MEDILYVLENLREKSQDDLYAVLPRNPDGLARYYHTSCHLLWCAYVDDVPAAIFGAREEREGVWGLFGFGTDQWDDVWRLVTLVSIRDMIPAIYDAGPHRIHLISPAGHADTHKWLRFIAKGHKVHQTELPKYGSDGTDFIMLSWFKE